MQHTLVVGGFFPCAAQALLAKDGDVVCSFSGPLLVQQLVHKTAASLLNCKCKLRHAVARPAVCACDY